MKNMRHINSFDNCWLFSTNHKDIVSLNIIFSLGAGFLGLALSILMRIDSKSRKWDLGGNYQLQSKSLIGLIFLPVGEFEFDWLIIELVLALLVVNIIYLVISRGNFLLSELTYYYKYIITSIVGAMIITEIIINNDLLVTVIVYTRYILAAVFVIAYSLFLMFYLNKTSKLLLGFFLSFLFISMYLLIKFLLFMGVFPSLKERLLEWNSLVELNYFVIILIILIIISFLIIFLTAIFSLRVFFKNVFVFRDLVVCFIAGLLDLDYEKPEKELYVDMLLIWVPATGIMVYSILTINIPLIMGFTFLIFFIAFTPPRVAENYFSDSEYRSIFDKQMYGTLTFASRLIYKDRGKPNFEFKRYYSTDGSVEAAASMRYGRAQAGFLAKTPRGLLVMGGVAMTGLFLAGACYSYHSYTVMQMDMHKASMEMHKEMHKANIDLAKTKSDNETKVQLAEIAAKTKSKFNLF